MLFSPVKLKNITLPGRIVRAATEYFCSTPDGHAAPCEYEVYKNLSKQPLGLIISANTCVSPEGRSNLWQNAIWDDAFIPDTRSIANAALRAKKAGMSGVMLHCAHGFLLSQFFYPATNHRTDAFGGSAENRFRITYEIMEAIKASCGDDYPLFMKINVTDENLTEDYYADLVTALGRTGDMLDAVETSGWNAIAPGVAKKPYFMDTVKRLHNDVPVPLIEVGGFRSADGMLDALEAGACAVSISRPLLREPDFPTKIRDHADTISKCKGCGFCLSSASMGMPTRCPFAE